MEGNSVCADCEKPNPRWVHMGFTIFLCTRCAGVHGMFAGNPGCVVSLRSADRISRAQIKSLRDGGNSRSNQKRRRSTRSQLVDTNDLNTACRLIQKKYYAACHSTPSSPSEVTPQRKKSQATPVEDLLMSAPAETPTTALMSELVGDTQQPQRPATAQQAVMNCFNQLPAGSIPTGVPPQPMMPNPQMLSLTPSPNQMSQMNQMAVQNQMLMAGNTGQVGMSQGAQGTGPGGLFYRPNHSPEKYHSV